MQRKIFNFVLVFFVISGNTSEKLPKFLNELRCPLDENLGKCAVINANKAIPEVVKGVPELGIPNLNPLKLGFRRLINHPELQLNLSDMSLYGLENVKMFNMEAALDAGFIKECLECSNLTIKGNYAINGTFLSLPITGNGRFLASFKNGIYNATIFFDVIEKNGDQYMRKKKVHIDMDLEDATFDINNLFLGNKEQGENALKIVQENWRHLLNGYGRFLEELLEGLFGLLYEKIVNPIPIKNQFL